MLDGQYVRNSQSYQEYLDILKEHAESGRTSGEFQKESLIKYTKLNYARVKRLEKQVLELDFAKFKRPRLSNLQPIAITETWCGDAVQSLPFINAYGKAMGWKPLRTLWRDANPELIDTYHTNGTRSIPKVLFVNEAMEVLATWGPRPKELQDYVVHAKTQPGYDYSEVSLYVQKWYNADKGVSTLREIDELARSLT